MQYRPLGKTGLDVSLLGFGLMRLPCLSDQEGKKTTIIDSDKTRDIFYKSLELGINYFDTALYYHQEQSEKILGHLVKESGKRKDLFICSKAPCHKITCTDHFEKFFNMQIENLQTDYIDVYMLHSLNKTRWEFMKKLGAIEFLEQKKKEGKINHIGFSFHDETDVLIDIVDDYDFEVAQIQLNYIDTKIQAGLEGFSYLSAKNMGVIIIEPLKGGTLAVDIPHDIKEIWDSSPIKRSPAEWAFRWLFDRKGISCVLSGMSSQEQVEENALIASDHKIKSLTRDEYELYSLARASMLEKAAVPCTGCGYCSPCSHGVNIPGIFSLYNQLVTFHDTKWVYNRYEEMTLNKETATDCTGCKKCTRKCPQGIDVPTHLRFVHETLSELKIC